VLYLSGAMPPAPFPYFLKADVVFTPSSFKDENFREDFSVLEWKESSFFEV
jgi:hypothetical protein